MGVRYLSEKKSFGGILENGFYGRTDDGRLRDDSSCAVASSTKQS